ncbi:phage tail tape measure protein [Bacillota bacterium HCP3S3_F1_1]
MADRIKGITIELDGDTTKLSNALKGVNKEIRDTQSNLKDVNKLLKMDPGNADLLAQKQKYLTDAIDATKKKLAEEKEALAQLKAGPQTEETQKQQEALTREIEATKQSLESLEDEYKKFGSVASQQLQVAGDKMKEVGGKISDVGEGLTKGITVPVAAVGAASVAAWKEVDEALDTVTEKTGASGAALEDMQNRAKSIAETIPTDFQTAGDAIGEVNTRFGLTGDALEDLSTKFVEFATLNSTDVSTSVDNVSSVLNAFGQSSDDAGNLLDALNQVGQATGVSMDTLSQDLAKNAGQFQAMGLSAEQAAGFMGSVEMSGLDTSTMLTGLTKAQKVATKNGQSLSDALKDFSKTMSSNQSDTEKLQAAYDLFGSRAGGAIYNAVQSGKLSLADLSTTLGDYAGSVENTFNETLDPLDQMTVVMNNLKDLGAEIVDASAPMITEAMTQIKDVVTGLKDAWDGLSPGMQEAIIKAALIAAAVGPVLVGVGKVVSAIGGITSTLGTFVGFISGTVIPAIEAVSVPILPIIAIIAAVVAAVIAVIEIVKHWGEISEWFGGVWSKVCDGVKTVGSALGDFFSGLWDGIKSTTETVWNGISGFFSGLWEGISGTAQSIFTGISDFLGNTWSTISSAASTAWSGITTTLSGAWDGIKTTAGTTFENVKTTIGTAWETVKTNTSTTWDAIQSSVESHGGGIKGVIGTAIDGYKSIWEQGFSKINELTGGKLGDALSAAQGKLGEIKGAFSSMIENAKSIVSGGLDRIKGFFAGCHLQLPHIKLPHFSISGSLSLNPPSVPHLSVDWYKKAMDDAYILNSPTIFGTAGGKLLGGGEAGQEAVVGTDKLAEIVQGALAGVSGGDIIIPVYIGQERIDEIVVRATQRSNYRSGGR